MEDSKQLEPKQPFSPKEFWSEHWQDIIRILIVGTLLLVIALNWDTFRNLNVEELVARTDNTQQAILVVLALFAVKSIVLIVPAAMVNIGVGVAFPPALGVVVNIMGVVVELTTSYLMGLFLGGDFVEKQLAKVKRGKEYLEDDSKNSLVVMFFLRFIPIFSVNAFSMFYGSAHYNYWKYLGVSMAGMLPRVVVLSLFGNAIYQYLPSFLA